MTTEIRRLIRVRSEKGAVFKRDGFGKKRQLAASWRKPRGQHNKQREQKKAKGALPKPGFGSPVAVRGMHPSGYFEVLVFAEKDLGNLDPKTQAIRISAGVGLRKRLSLQETAVAAGFKILNSRVVKEPVKKEETSEPAKKEAEEKKPEKPKKEVPPSREKKEVKKAPKTKEPQRSAETKKSGKSAAPAKTKEKPVKKPAEEQEEKTEKPEKKAAKPRIKEASKTPKKAAKPKAEKSPVTAAEKTRAEPKTKPRKKTGSEVKKND
jgi:large subunit ribosomal protein L32e